MADFGPLVVPLAVKESDIVGHGANNFVKVRERTAAEGELAGEYVLLSGETQLISQHDWAKLGVKQVDGSNDPDGFLDKAGSEGQEGGEFFSGIYKQLVTDGDTNDTLSGNEIRSALAEATLAGKVRQLFIKHESEWIKRASWQRLEQELTDKPNLYQYALDVTNNMAWIEEASTILGDSKPWFIHPAGMINLLAPVVLISNKCHKCQKDISLSFEFMRGFVSQSVSDEFINEFIARWNENAAFYGIDSCEQVINLLGQGKHETKRFTAFRESLVYRSYTAESLYAMAPTAINNGFARKGLVLSREEKMDYIRHHLLNNDAGYGEHSFGSNDFPGKDYRGRGLLHLTHSENYRSCALAIGLDIYSSPELVEVDMLPIVLSGFWYWKSNNLGEKADGNASDLDKTREITRVINPGLKGLEERIEFTEEARNLHVRLYGECN